VLPGILRVALAGWDPAADRDENPDDVEHLPTAPAAVGGE
jgi:hypothetical protein